MRSAIRGSCVSSEKTAWASRYNLLSDPTTITIEFGHTLPCLGQPPDGVVDWHSAVAMSPVLAKDLYKTLGIVLGQYEENVGPIADIPQAARTTAH
jgi:hypothetical protein